MRRGGTLLAGGLLVLQAGAGLPTTSSEAARRITEASLRPLPSVAPRQAPRPDTVWVPDRWVPLPGAPQGVHVPGHWERRLSEREVWVPPLTVIAPGGVQRAWPAGVREPAEARRGP